MIEAFMMTAFFPIFMFIWVLAVGGAFLYHFSLFVLTLVVVLSQGIYKITVFIFNKIYKLLIGIYRAANTDFDTRLGTLVIVFMALAVFLDWV